ncbi:MAG: glycosyltransferase family A protein [Acidobacteriota bacterium]
MQSPTVSVIIPAYNGARFLRDTIQSVIQQTISDWELIVVDDCSSDATGQIVKSFSDLRIKYIRHDRNRGSDKARFTGLVSSSGAIIAFLDQDDLFHPDKLKAHVSFFASHPKVGVTYNARFELNHSAVTIRDIWRPPNNISLADLVLGFPLAPSDVVLRREWASQMDLLGGSLSWCGGEIVHYCNLWLSGCQFAGINRALNYRRHHSGRTISDLEGGCKAEMYAQDKVFGDARCPEEVRALKQRAHNNIYLSWACRALDQEETQLAEKYLTRVVRTQPSILQGTPCELGKWLLNYCIDDESRSHSAVLKKMCDQLPPEASNASAGYDTLVGVGFLVKGVRAILWNRPQHAAVYFAAAAKAQITVDEQLIQQMAFHLLSYEREYGWNACDSKMSELALHLETIGGKAVVHQVTGVISANRAFQSYKAGHYGKVSRDVSIAVRNSPNYLKNRGVMAIVLRSWLKLGIQVIRR